MQHSYTCVTLTCACVHILLRFGATTIKECAFCPYLPFPSGNDRSRRRRNWHLLFPLRVCGRDGPWDQGQIPEDPDQELLQLSPQRDLLHRPERVLWLGRRTNQTEEIEVPGIQGSDGQVVRGTGTEDGQMVQSDRIPCILLCIRRRRRRIQGRKSRKDKRGKLNGAGPCIPATSRGSLSLSQHWQTKRGLL